MSTVTWLQLTVVALGFSRFTTLLVYGLQLQLSDVFALLASVSWAMSLLRTRRMSPSYLYLPLMLYLAGAVLSLTQADSIGRSAFKLVGISSLFAVVVVEANTLDRARAERLADTVILTALCGAALVVVGLLLHWSGLPLARNPFVGHFGSLASGPIPRMQGPFRNSNMFCNWLGVACCLAYGRREALLVRWGRGWCAGGACVLGIAIATTMSPQIGAIAVSAIVILLAGASIPGAIRVGGVAAAATVTCLFAVVTLFRLGPAGHGISLGPFGALSLQPGGRLVGWSATLDTIRAHPLVGTGIGESVAKFRFLFPGQGTDIEHHAAAHNAPLNLLAQAGPLALGGWLLLLGRSARRALVGARDSWGVGVGAAVIGMCVWGGMWNDIEDARHLWVLLGMAAADRA
jgi:hypothetical protein